MHAFHSDQRRVRCFATFEASARAENIRTLVAGSHAAVRIERSPDSPLGLDGFDICADENDLKAAVENTSAVLLALDAAAQRGALSDVRVLPGARIPNTGGGRLRWKTCTRYRRYVQ